MSTQQLQVGIGTPAEAAPPPRHRLPGFRHQPPAYSPLPADAPLRALACLLPFGEDARERLSARLRSDYRAGDVVLCGSGTQALLLGLRAVAQRRHEPLRVALPGYSCYDVGAAAVAAGARILLYDVDPDTLGPALDSVERALRLGANTVVAAHLYGVPIAWESLCTLCNEFGATLIEDAAQGFGGSSRGQPLGGFGELAVLSFGRGKGWTGGVGGALLARGDWAQVTPGQVLEAATPTAAVSTAAVAAALVLLSHPAVYRAPASIPWLRLGDTIYRPAPAPAELSAAAAALVEHSRRTAEREAAARRSNAAGLLAGLRRRPGVCPVIPIADAAPGYLRLPVRVHGGLAALADARTAGRLGIAPGYPAPLSSLAPVRERMAASHALPGSAQLAGTLLTLPTHSRLRDEERREVLRLVNSARVDH